MFRYPGALFLSRFLMPPIRVFYVYKKRKRRVLLSTLTTYQMAGGTSYVFLPWKPEKMDSVQRFHLLHEIGHAFITNRIMYAQGWFAVVYLCLLFVFVAFHREAGILALFVAFALAAMWAHHMEQQGNTYERLELAADTFALVNLVGRPDFLTTIACVTRTFRKGSERARLLIQRAQIFSRTTTEFRVGWEQSLNLFEQTVPSVPLWLGLSILAGMLWLGATLRIKDVEELLALSLVWVVVPALYYYYRMLLRSTELPSTFRGRREALKFLQAHAPRDLPEERRVTSPYDLV